MQNESLNRAETHPHRRPAVWPWLLIPLVTLALFYALTVLRDTALERAGSTTAPYAHPAQDSASN